MAIGRALMWWSPRANPTTISLLLMSQEIVCSRCRREARRDEYPAPDATDWPHDWPRNWEGSNDDAVCPGCQLAVWHPYCTGLIDGEGQHVAVDRMPREEVSPDLVLTCGTIDLSVSWQEGEDPPTSWRCPRCGGSEFIGAHEP